MTLSKLLTREFLHRLIDNCSFLCVERNGLGKSLVEDFGISMPRGPTMESSGAGLRDAASKRIDAP